MKNPFKELAAKALEPELKEVLTFYEQQDNNLGLLQERLAELELALDETGWERISGTSNKEFSRSALRKINQLARTFWLKNPLIKRAVYTQTSYVFAQGVSIQAEHPDINEVVQEFIDDRKNRAELFEHQSLMLKETELQLFANLFFVFFRNISTGRVRLGTISPDEIEDIIYNPENSKDPWYYFRVWTEIRTDIWTGERRIEQKKAYYPDWRYKPFGGHPPYIGGVAVMDQTPIYHVAVNCLSDMKFGVSEVYAATDWAKAYTKFLEDWTTIVHAYSRFAMKLTTQSKTKKAVTAARDKLRSTLFSAGQENNPASTTGSTFIAQEGVKLEPIKTAGATTSMDDARRLLLMVSAGMGIFEHYFGDPSTGNLATAKAMERPMELMFRDRQALWSSAIHEILQYVVDSSVKAPSGKLHKLGTVEQNEYEEQVVVMKNDVENDNPDLQEKPINRRISVKFPSLLEHDIDTLVNAIVQASTTQAVPLKTITKWILQAFEEENIDEILDRLFPDGEGEDLSGPDTEASAVEDMMVKAVSDLSEGLRRMGGIA